MITLWNGKHKDSYFIKCIICELAYSHSLFAICAVSAFDIKGPSQARIECLDNEDGSADVTYFPTQDGEYAVHVLFDGEDVDGSPFMVRIQPSDGTFDPLKVRFSAFSVTISL